MDTRVDQDEHPDWWRHVSHTSPHRQHSSRMVVLLESRAALALCKDDGCIEHLVELGEVEPPTPESKTFVPHSANISCVWQACITHEDVGVLAAPRVCVRVVGDSIAKSARAVNLAERINGTDYGIGVAVVRERTL